MKSLFKTWGGALFAFLGCLPVWADLGPGWFSVAPSKVVELQEGGEPWQPPAFVPASGLMEGLSGGLPGGQAVPLSIPGSPRAAEVTPEIAALAADLGNDATRIFWFVRSQISYQPYFGSMKGAQGTLLDGAGNAWDQSNLLVALLRAAGHTQVGYINGAIFVRDWSADGHDLEHWLGVRRDLVLVTMSSLAALYGAQNQGTNLLFVVDHVWVRATIDDQVYDLDPSYERSEAHEPLDLALASGFDRAQLLADAAGQEGAGFSENLDRQAVEARLTTYASALRQDLIANHGTASIEEIAGGATRLGEASPTLANGAPRASFSPSPLLGWNEMPASESGNYRVRIGTEIDRTFRTDELGGRRLTVAFSGSGQAQLWLDDTLLEEEITPQGLSVALILGLDHPQNQAASFLGADFDQTLDAKTLKRDAVYDITPSVFPEGKSAGRGDASDKQVAAYLAANVSETSREVLSESLRGMGVKWTRQIDLAGKVAAGLGDGFDAIAHVIGICGQEDSFFVDMPGLTGVSANATGTSPRIFNATLGLLSAFEHAVVEQAGAPRATSTIRSLVEASDAGQKIYRATSANWSAVSSGLTNYSPARIADLGGLTSQGFTLLLHEDGLTPIDDWSGFGYAQQRQTTDPVSGLITTQGKMIISGDISGGFATVLRFIDGKLVAFLYYEDVLLGYKYLGTERALSAEPVDLRTGAYLFEKNDLTVGSGNTPRGLDFARFYDSRRVNPTEMGRGWVHSCHGRINLGHSLEVAFGLFQSRDAAQILIAGLAALEFGDFSGSSKELMLWVMAAHWAADATVRNSANVEIGNTRMAFTRQADGTWSRPPGTKSELGGDTGSFVLKPHLQGEIAFDAENRLAAWADPDGITRTYSYNTDGRLQTVTDAGGRTFTLAYNPSGLLTSVADSTGRTVSFGHTGDLLTSVTDPENHTTTLLYNPSGWLAEWIDPLGDTIARNEYDLQGRVIRQFSRGDLAQEWTFGYRPGATTETDPEGRITTHLFDSQDRYAVVRDPLGNAPVQIHNAANRVTESWDASGRRTGFEYDFRDNLILRENPDGEYETFIHDSQDRLTAAFDAAGFGTWFTYDSEHHLTSTTDAGGRTTTFTYKPNGLIDTITTPSGDVTTFTQDTFGNIVGIARPDGTSSSATYNSRGDQLTATDGRGKTTTFTFDNRRLPLTRTDANGHTTSWDFDANGYPASIINRRGLTTTTPADNFGLVQSINAPDTGAMIFGYDVRDLLVSTTDGLSHETTITRDEAGRPAATIDPLGITKISTGFDPDARITATANGLNQTTTFGYDSFGRPAGSTDPLGREIASTFDPAGRQLTLTNRNGNTFEYGYGPDGLPTTFTHPSGRESAIAARDLAGRPAALIEPSGQQTTLTYDTMSRIKTQTDGVGTITWNYDGEGNPLTVVQGSETIARTFDNLGRILTCTDTQGQTVSYGYDPEGNISSITYPDGRVVTYTYDGANRLKTVTDWANRVTTYTYDNAGRLTSTQRPNGTTATFGYDDANRLTSTTDVHGTTSIWQASYGYDNAYRLTTFTPTPPTRTYAPPPATMTYDVDNRLESYNGQSVASDLDGNLLQAPLNGTLLGTLNWDARNRLIGTESNIQNSQPIISFYSYDSENRRTSRTIDNQTTTYTWSRGALDRLLVKTNPDGSITRYIHGLGLIYEETEPAFGPSTSQFYHYNWQGSTMALTDDTGNVTARLSYSPYGEVTLISGSLTTPFLFNGQFGVMTEPNGLYCMMARFYSPTFRRFLSEDPAGFNGGINLYAYAAGDPVNLMDPFGLGPRRVGVDINLFEPGSSLHKTAQQILANLDAYLVAGHGSPFGTEMSASDLARSIQKLPDYDPNKSVLLLICEAAGDTGNAYVPNVAQQLSEIIPNSVIGSDSQVSLTRPPDWSFWGNEGSYSIPPGGMWIQYNGGNPISATMNLSLGGALYYSTKK